MGETIPKDEKVTVKVTVPEKDKPFILAISTLGAFLAELGATVYVAVVHPTADLALTILKDAMTLTGTLLTMAWTFYLVKKNGNGK